MAELLVLVLGPDNPCNTTITNANNEDNILYKVWTEHNKDTFTYVQNADEEKIASWQWKDVRSDLVTIGTSKPIPSSAWLHRSIIPFVNTVSFKDSNGRTYKWKGCEPGRQMELYAADDKVHPIAQFKKSFSINNRDSDPPRKEYTPAKLTLDSRGQEIQNLVIISFLLLERRRKGTENSVVNMADSLAIRMAIT